MTFRKAPNRRWDEGVVVGLSGEGIVPISYLTLANVANLGITVSGNGGVMDYQAAATLWRWEHVTCNLHYCHEIWSRYNR